MRTVYTYGHYGEAQKWSILRLASNVASFNILTATMNDASNRNILVLLGLCDMIQFAVMLVLFRLSKRSFGENHLIVLFNLLSVSLTDLHGERRVQVQKLSHSANWKATVATAEAVAVDQQKVSTARRQVTM